LLGDDVSIFARQPHFPIITPIW